MEGRKKNDEPAFSLAYQVNLQLSGSKRPHHKWA